ncbi:MAG: hypothetical protein ABIK68_11415 [bacterium]
MSNLQSDKSHSLVSKSTLDLSRLILKQAGSKLVADQARQKVVDFLQDKVAASKLEEIGRNIKEYFETNDTARISEIETSLAKDTIQIAGSLMLGNALQSGAVVNPVAALVILGFNMAVDYAFDDHIDITAKFIASIPGSGISEVEAQKYLDTYATFERLDYKDFKEFMDNGLSLDTLMNSPLTGYLKDIEFKSHLIKTIKNGLADFKELGKQLSIDLNEVANKVNPEAFADKLNQFQDRFEDIKEKGLTPEILNSLGLDGSTVFELVTQNEGIDIQDLKTDLISQALTDLGASPEMIEDLKNCKDLSSIAKAINEEVLNPKEWSNLPDKLRERLIDGEISSEELKQKLEEFSGTLDEEISQSNDDNPENTHQDPREKEDPESSTDALTPEEEILVQKVVDETGGTESPEVIPDSLNQPVANDLEPPVNPSTEALSAESTDTPSVAEKIVSGVTGQFEQAFSNLTDLMRGSIPSEAASAGQELAAVSLGGAINAGAQAWIDRLSAEQGWSDIERFTAKMAIDTSFVNDGDLSVSASSIGTSMAIDMVWDKMGEQLGMSPREINQTQSAVEVLSQLHTPGKINVDTALAALSLDDELGSTAVASQVVPPESSEASTLGIVGGAVGTYIGSIMGGPAGGYIGSTVGTMIGNTAGNLVFDADDSDPKSYAEIVFNENSGEFEISGSWGEDGMDGATGEKLAQNVLETLNGSDDHPGLIDSMTGERGQVANGRYLEPIRIGFNDGEYEIDGQRFSDAGRMIETAVIKTAQSLQVEDGNPYIQQAVLQTSINASLGKLFNNLQTASEYEILDTHREAIQNLQFKSLADDHPESPLLSSSGDRTPAGPGETTDGFSQAESSLTSYRETFRALKTLDRSVAAKETALADLEDRLHQTQGSVPVDEHGMPVAVDPRLVIETKIASLRQEIADLNIQKTSQALLLEQAPNQKLVVIAEYQDSIAERQEAVLETRSLTEQLPELEKALQMAGGSLSADGMVEQPDLPPVAKALQLKIEAVQERIGELNEIITETSERAGTLLEEGGDGFYLEATDWNQIETAGSALSLSDADQLPDANRLNILLENELGLDMQTVTIKDLMLEVNVDGSLDIGFRTEGEEPVTDVDDLSHKVHIDNWENWSDSSSLSFANGKVYDIKPMIQHLADTTANGEQQLDLNAKIEEIWGEDADLDKIDFAFGGDGDDIIVTGETDDYIDAGEGDNIIHAGDGDNYIRAGDGDNQVFSGDGDDQVFLGDGDNIVDTGDGDNIITVGNGNNRISAGEGNDRLTVGHGDNIIDAGDGDNIITAGDGSNQVFTGTGADHVSLGDGDHIVNAGDGDNTVEGGAGNSQIFTGGGDDTITLGEGDKVVSAGDGDNVIDTGIGDSIIVTGSGDDQILTEKGNQTIQAGDGNNIIQAASGDSTIESGEGDDRITAEGGEQFISAGGGDNTITVGDGNSRISSGDGNDRIAVGDGEQIIQAGAGENIITAGDGDSIFSTGAGNDRIHTGDGDQTIYAGDGNNTISAGIGGSTIVSGEGDDHITLEGGNQSVQAGDGENIIRAGSGNSTIITGSGSDSITLENGDQSVHAGDGDNRVTTASGNSRVVTGAGDDTITMGDGNQVVQGGEGSNTIRTEVGDSVIATGAGDDHIDLGSGNQTVFAGDGNNVISAADGHQVIYTGDGQDRIEVGHGDHLIQTGDGGKIILAGDGDSQVTTGAGDDRIEIDDGNQWVHAGDGDNTIRVGDGDSRIETGAGDDTITTGKGDQVVIAGSGDNIIYTGDGAQQIVTEAGADQISTGAGDDLIAAGEGDNRINSGAGDDLVLTGAGNDRISAGAGDDTISAGAGADEIDGGAGIDTISYRESGEGVSVDLEQGFGAGGDAEGDRLTNIENVEGSAHDDTLLGNQADNILSGGAGDDHLSGGMGRDRFLGGEGSDTVSFDYTDPQNAQPAGGIDASLGGSTDQGFTRFDDDRLDSIENVSGSRSDDRIQGNLADNIMDGGAGDDIISSLDGDDDLYGGTGNDRLYGGAGNDILSGGSGDDLLFGESGSDTFLAGSGNDRIVGGEGEDTYISDQSIENYAFKQLGENIEITDVATGDVTAVREVEQFQFGDQTFHVNQIFDLASPVGFDCLASVDLEGDGIESANVYEHPRKQSASKSNTGLQAAQLSMAAAFGIALATIPTAIYAEESDGTRDLAGDSIFGLFSRPLAFHAVNPFKIPTHPVHQAPVMVDATLEDGAVIPSQPLMGDLILSGDNQPDSVTFDPTMAAISDNDLGTASPGDSVITGMTAPVQANPETGTEGIVAEADVGTIEDSPQNAARTTVVIAPMPETILDIVETNTDDQPLYSTAGDEGLLSLAADKPEMEILGSELLADGRLEIDGTPEADSLTGDIEAVRFRLDLGPTLSAENINDGDTILSVSIVLPAGVSLSRGTYQAVGNSWLLTGEDLADLEVIIPVGIDSFDIQMQAIAEKNGIYTYSDLQSLELNILGAGNDTIDGLDGDDEISGGLGDDTLTGGAGIDVLSGGEGDDNLIVDGDDSRVDGGSGNDTAWLVSDQAGNREFDTGVLADVEALKGSDGDDLIIDSARGNYTIDAGEGTDILSYETATSGVTVNLDDDLTGTDAKTGFEKLVGSDFDDDLSGDSQNDIIEGGPGDDRLAGEQGADQLAGGAGNDSLSGNDGADILAGNSGNDRLFGGTGQDELNGGAGDDSLSGGADDDILLGESGNDVLSGDAGNDTLDSGSGDDILSGGSGDDVLSAGHGVDVLDGNDGNDLLDGGEGDDTIWGGEGVDMLLGGEGDDLLDGGAGDDSLLGGEGTDSLQGGTGDDMLVFDHLDILVDGGEGTDIAALDEASAGQSVDTR